MFLDFIDVDAAQNWEVEYTDMMKGPNFEQGAHSVCVFYRE